jgi:hypothetical protein
MEGRIVLYCRRRIGAEYTDNYENNVYQKQTVVYHG